MAGQYHKAWDLVDLGEDTFGGSCVVPRLPVGDASEVAKQGQTPNIHDEDSGTENDGGQDREGDVRGCSVALANAIVDLDSSDQRD